MAEVVANVIDCYPFRRAGGRIEFLMIKRAAQSYMGGTWQGVHGKIEPGETAVQAALRELHEETGLTPIGFWQLDGVNAFYFARRDCVQICPCFTAEVAPAAAVVLSDEHTEHRWLPADEALAAFMWPGQRRSIREALDEIIALGPAEPALRIPLPPAS